MYGYVCTIGPEKTIQKRVKNAIIMERDGDCFGKKETTYGKICYLLFSEIICLPVRLFYCSVTGVEYGYS